MSVSNLRCVLLASLFASWVSGIALSQDTLHPILSAPWKTDGFTTVRFEITGTGSRNNPLRSALAAPYNGDELFIRYRLRYAAESIDEPPKPKARPAKVGSGADGEFFVMWLDQTEGHATSAHASNIPNVGIHVHEGQNRFMVRYSPASQRFSEALVGDREFLLVARLYKSNPGQEEPFDLLELWVNPERDDQEHPAAVTQSPRSISTVRWIGFSTGGKTEPGDRIDIWDIDVAASWHGILGLPEPEPRAPMHQPLTPTVSFKEHVFPILKQHCFACHQGEDAEDGVRLDVFDELLNHTSPRNGTSSHLIQLVRNGQMPPEGEPRLSDEEINTLSTWIDEGLQWDEALLPTPQPKSNHWALAPIVRPPVPDVDDSDWVRTPIDAFIAAKHQSMGLRANPQASTDTLNRRMSLDLLGLPPQHITDSVVPDIDRLLSDPGFGERWARYWLDVARWAESNGHQHNRLRPHAWRYRDWVIQSIAEDRPYDSFLHMQIAGDLMRPARSENLIATGFMAAARYSGNELDKAIQRNDILVDVANTTASAMLGLTMECAQCHSHKFDPISIRDYYRFQSFFASGQPGNLVLDRSEKAASLIHQRWEIFDRVHQRLVTVKRRQGHPEPIYITPTNVKSGMTTAEREQFAGLEKQIAQLQQTWGYAGPSESEEQLLLAPHEMRWPLPRLATPRMIPEACILVRGEVQSRGPAVSPGWPRVFGMPGTENPLSRKDLAEWMTNRNNPITARVWVNRIWGWHFGRGLVETSSDYGTQGTAPSHPKLLDFLADELMSHQWSTNHIHRLILQSATYRLSHAPSEHNESIDPENRLLWRWNVRRLESEALRDSILAVSGQLDRDAGGPGDKEDSNRRSVYLRQHRERFPYQQRLFDSAEAITSCPGRRVSTSPLQPLWLLNSQFMQRAAEHFAQRAENPVQAFRLALGREPTGEQAKRLAEVENSHGLASVCLALLNASEFIYIP